jgi:hypothetical protein
LPATRQRTGPRRPTGWSMSRSNDFATTSTADRSVCVAPDASQPALALRRYGTQPTPMSAHIGSISRSSSRLISHCGA